MSQQDIDMTILTRSLKLLHSPEEDSAEQLRMILEDIMKSKYGNRKSINLTGLGLSKKVLSSGDKTKRIKLDESATSSTPYTSVVDESQSSDSESDGGVALEILDDDLACVICREMAVGAGNNLVECSECHALYHQECHAPPITQDVNDPRFVWYCADCTKTMSKVGVSNSSKGSPSSANQSYPSKPAKPSNKASAPSSKQQQSFGGFTSSSKSSSSSSSSSSKHSSSGHASSKSNSIPVPKINITADKRLQIMKKNAAKKQEKRKLTK